MVARMSFYITKMSGEQELFNPEKLRRSLRKVKTPEEIIEEILREVERNPALRTTKEIYGFAYNYLKHTKPALGARYSLKQALLDLGPAGFPFEQFIAELFRKEGYAVVTNQIVSGHCIDHEVDLICANKHEQYMVECKFHMRQDLKSDVKVSLYVKARFDDVKEAWEKKGAPQYASTPKELGRESHAGIHTGGQFHQAWIVTNTKFTSEAIKFALCRNIQLIGWAFPEGNALPDLVAKYGLDPVTALTSLSGSQKKMLIANGITLCREVTQYKTKLRELGFSQKEIDDIVKESSEVCTL